LLIHGARAVIECAKYKPQWLEQLITRRPHNVAAVALANKMARIAWAIVAHKRVYRSDWCATPSSAA
jgi:transposase